MTVVELANRLSDAYQRAAGEGKNGDGAAMWRAVAVAAVDVLGGLFLDDGAAAVEGDQIVVRGP